MTIKVITRSMLNQGSLVEINPSDDRSRKKIVSGTVAEILTSAETHPHGIKVRLETGETGRVKNIDSGVSKPNSFINTPPHSQANEVKIRLTVEEVISNGEDHFAEFKSSMLWSEKLTPAQIEKSSSKEIRLYKRAAAKVIIAKSLAGFLNSTGGTLLIGVKENKDSKEDEIIGIEREFKQLGDPCEDGYRRKILDAIIKPYFPSFIFNHFNNYLEIKFVSLSGKLVCAIRANKSDAKVFLNIYKKDHFFVRIDASTRELQGEEIVDYCVKRFS